MTKKDTMGKLWCNLDLGRQPGFRGNEEQSILFLSLKPLRKLCKSYTETLVDSEIKKRKLFSSFFKYMSPSIDLSFSKTDVGN